MLYAIIALAALWGVSYGIMIRMSMRNNPNRLAYWFPALVIAEQITIALLLILYILAENV